MTNGLIYLTKDDITTLSVDAIVNAANPALSGGGGVDGAIHKAAGHELMKACKKLNGCNPGFAKITPAFKLPSRFVIHTVGPVWQGGQQNEADLLKNCYETSLNLAFDNKCKTIAIPNISTGVYGFPKKEAAKIAIETVKSYLRLNRNPKTIYFVCFDSENYTIYEEMLG